MVGAWKKAGFHSATRRGTSRCSASVKGSAWTGTGSILGSSAARSAKAPSRSSTPKCQSGAARAMACRVAKT
jgi:hypothetical protein